MKTINDLKLSDRLYVIAVANDKVLMTKYGENDNFHVTREFLVKLLEEMDKSKAIKL